VIFGEEEGVPWVLTGKSSNHEASSGSLKCFSFFVFLTLIRASQKVSCKRESSNNL